MGIYTENKTGGVFYNGNLEWEERRIKSQNICNEIFDILSLMGIKRQEETNFS